MDDALREYVTVSACLLFSHGFDHDRVMSELWFYTRDHGIETDDNEIVRVANAARDAVGREPAYYHLLRQLGLNGDHIPAPAPDLPHPVPMPPNSPPQPFHLWAIAQGVRPEHEELFPNSRAAFNTDPGRYAWNELEVAMHVQRHHGDYLRYVAELDLPWVFWTGNRWEPNLPAVTARLIIREIQTISRQIHPSTDDPIEKKARERLSSFLNSGKLHGISKCLSEFRGIAMRLSDFDTNLNLLNVQNCTIDLRTRQPQPANPMDHITKVANVRYDPSATCPRWEAFLAEILPDVATRAFLQRAVGMALSGEVRDNAIVFAVGPGANGKTVFFGVIAEILGEYAGVVPAHVFLEGPGGSSKEFILATLKGKRFLSCEEFPEDKRMDEPIVKALTGGSGRAACYKHKSHFTYTPTDHIYVATNHLPRVVNMDLALERRIHIVPFSVIIPPERRNRQLKDQLLEERSGILNWLLDGYQEYAAVGLQPPREVTEALDKYKKEMDVLAPFDEKYLIHDKPGDPPSRTLAMEVYLAYRQWCRENYFQHNQIWSQTKFGTIMGKRRDVNRVKSNGIMYYEGIRLNPKSPVYPDEVPKDYR